MLEKLKEIVDKHVANVKKHYNARTRRHNRIRFMEEHILKREAEYLRIKDEATFEVFDDFQTAISEIQKIIEEIEPEQSKQPAEAESECRNGIFHSMFLLGKPKTIGELRALIAGYPSEIPFGFFNQPTIQALYNIDNVYIAFKEEAK